MHLLREHKKVDQYLDTNKDWQAFRKKLKRLIQDAIRLCHRREELSVEKYTSLKQRNLNPIDTIVATLREYCQTGKLPHAQKREFE